MSNATDLVQVEIDDDVVKIEGQEYNKGDRKSFAPNIAKIICQAGWGHAVNGEFETGERVAGSKAIKPDDMVIK